MRPDCGWSMSTAGLTAQEICLPSQSLFLRGSHCHSMAGAKPSWKYDHDLDNLYFTLNASVNYTLQPQSQVAPFFTTDKQRFPSHSIHIPKAQPLPPKKSRPTQLSLSSTAESYTPSPVEDDQVVPGFQRLSVSDRISPPQTPSRVDKPLPPIPGSVAQSADPAMDNEMEFFTGDDCRCLVPEPCPKPSPFRYGQHSRRSFRDYGKINPAYFEGPVCQQSKQQTQPKKKQELEPLETLLQQQRQQEQKQQEQKQHHQQQQQQLKSCLRQQDRAQRMLRRSHSGPAGSFNKPSALRLSCHQRNSQGQDKPEVPPRVPIPPRPAKTPDSRRWSAEVSSGAYSDEDRPPKVPPREPLTSSLPSYHNGIMPPTQSFAPDPKYVSRGLQRQNSEGSPCILPVMENGRKASTTHYFLLPQRPNYLDKHEKYFVDSAASRSAEASGSSLDCQSKRKMHSDLV